MLDLGEARLLQIAVDVSPAVGQFWHELIGDSPPRLSTEIQRAACAILWMGPRGEREGLPSMLATSFAGAAGVSGRQKWGLVLSSSARVSQVTYQTVGVRYPELVTFNGSQWKFGKCFFFSWMLHGSTKVVVRAVALLSANTRINRMSLSKVVYVSESNN